MEQEILEIQVNEGLVDPAERQELGVQLILAAARHPDLRGSKVRVSFVNNPSYPDGPVGDALRDVVKEAFSPQYGSTRAE